MIVTRNLPSTCRKIPRFSTPVAKIKTPAIQRNPRPYRFSKYSGTVRISSARSRLITNPVRPTSHIVKAAITPIVTATKPLLYASSAK